MFFWLNIVLLTIVVIAFYFKNEFPIVELLFNISLGFFCSALVAFFVALINARSKNETILEDILFHSKQVKYEYNKFLYMEKEKFSEVASKIIIVFTEFYAKYKTLDFSCFVNTKYESQIIELFKCLQVFVTPFMRVVNNMDSQSFSEAELNQSYIEATINPNIPFYKFIIAYKDLYELVDKDLWNDVLQWDEWENFDFKKKSKKKHKTIKEIIKYFEKDLSHNN